mmetsp:Transcript_2645/g.7915  ORF Transcript_2645/g.7915 Transcript_2645/m.7915 type:complete len:661 (+) Transcript_2645:149-2131(+)
MGSYIEIEAADGTKKREGLNVLDLVKHATKAILNILDKDDRCAVVAFNRKSRTVFPLTRMTDANRDQCTKLLLELEETGGTNLWDGVHSGLECLREGQGSVEDDAVPRKSTVMVLTDGRPTTVPPRGFVETLRSYNDKHPDFAYQLSTFGFHYDLDSDLLHEFARVGNGTFSFIPDGPIVGTTFVDGIANILSTLAQRSTLALCPLGDARIVGPVLGGNFHERESWGVSVDLGPLQLGHSRDIVVPMRIPDGESAYLEAVVSYALPGERPLGSALRVAAQGASRSPLRGGLVAEFRCKAVDLGHAILGRCDTGQLPPFMRTPGHVSEAQQQRVRTAEVEAIAFAAEMVPHLKDNPGLSDLHVDISGRFCKSLKGHERFNRWGKHYLRALTRAHELQMCTNFMDRGLKPYGGTLFRHLRDTGDRIFVELTPPVPSNPPEIAFTQAQAPWAGHALARGVDGHHNRRLPPVQAPPPRIDMTTYHAGEGGGCFGGTSTVVVQDPSTATLQSRRVCDILAGDRVAVADGTFATVLGVARIAHDTARPMTLLPSGLTITENHPIRVRGEWTRPINVPDRRTVRGDDVVYNFVVSANHILLVNGVECITWGHGRSEDGVRHTFYGTRRVVDAVAALPGWTDGLVDIAGNVRDQDGHTVAFLPQQSSE